MHPEVSVEDDVAIVRLDWPEKRNSVTAEEAAAIAGAVAQCAQLAAVLVICGGPAAFCAGGDLDSLVSITSGAESESHSAIYNGYQAAVRAVAAFPGVTIAAVDGLAIGFGADLALCCDYRLVGPDAWFEQGWRRLAVIPGTGGVWLAARTASPLAAWSLLLEPGRLTAPRLHELGLAVYAPDGAETAALERARHLAQLPIDVVRAYATLTREAPSQTYDEHLAACLAFQTGFLASPEFARRAEAVLRRSAR